MVVPTEARALGRAAVHQMFPLRDRVFERQLYRKTQLPVPAHASRPDGTGPEVKTGRGARRGRKRMSPWWPLSRLPRR